MTSIDGQTAVQTGNVETAVGIFDVPLVLGDYGVEAMTKISRVSFFIDQSADVTPSWKLASFTVTGFHTDIDDAGVCHVFTSSGSTIIIDSMTETGASAHPLRGQRDRPRAAPPCPPFVADKASPRVLPLDPRRRRLDHDRWHDVPHL